ncbi:MAG: glycosyltransferase family 4 protein, partial [Prevotella sp.]|nr:glycosyltransferase family 4 protein [Prevotella sp.]
LYIAIHTLYELRRRLTDAEFADVRLHIVGDGNQTKYRLLAQKLGIQDNINWYGKMSHDDVQSMMRTHSLLLFTSIAEGTPHVVLEAIANRLPVVCHDCCGHGDSIDATVGVKIPLVSPEKSVSDFSNVIADLYRNHERLEEMKRNCPMKAVELSWNTKADRILSLYEKAIRENIHS